MIEIAQQNRHRRAAPEEFLALIDGTTCSLHRAGEARLKDQRHDTMEMNLNSRRKNQKFRSQFTTENVYGNNERTRIQR
jgi:hypothetical protein